MLCRYFAKRRGFYTKILTWHLKAMIKMDIQKLFSAQITTPKVYLLIFSLENEVETLAYFK